LPFTSVNSYVGVIYKCLLCSMLLCASCVSLAVSLADVQLAVNLCK